MRVFLFIMINVVLAASLPGANPLPANQKAPDFILNDQRDQPFHLQESEGKMVIVLAADREADEKMVLWRRKLTEQYRGTIEIIGVADMRPVPSFMKKIAKSRFKKDSARILMDWQGEVFAKYGLPANMPNIVVIDKQGIIRHVCSGEAKPAAVERLFSEIDRWNN